MSQEIVEGYGLSPQQERVWRLQGDDARGVYRAQCAVEVRGGFDERALREALRAVVERHEILRTSFRRVADSGLPVQVVEEPRTPDVDAHDFSGLSDGERAARVEALWREGLAREFDAEAAPLLRVTLARLAPDAHMLLLTLPALCADARTLRNLVEQIALHYHDAAGAFADGEDAALSDEPTQYADFAEWQRELLSDDETKAGRDHWRGQDFKPSAKLTLPAARADVAEESEAAQATREAREARATKVTQGTDGARGAESAEAAVSSADVTPRSFVPAEVSVELDAEVYRRIGAEAERAGVAVRAWLLACWQVLLWRLNRDSLAGELFVGVCGEGRPFEELRDALGLFARYVPVACRLDERTIFLDALRQVEESLSEAERMQPYFDWDEAAALSDAQGAPLDFLPFAFDFAATEGARAGLGFSVVRLYACIDRYKVKLSCGQDAAGLKAALHYDAGAYREADVRLLAEQYAALLQDTASNVGAHVGELSLLGARERHRLLVEWNETRADYGDTHCVHQLFERQAARAPDAVALVYEGERLTYRELNERANRLAHHLRTVGVGPEVRVGLMLERSVEMVVALVGVLKAGGAYVPLDPQYPADRLAFMLADARADVVLVQRELLARLPATEGEAADDAATESRAVARRVVVLEDEAEAIGAQGVGNPSAGVTPENLAYVIYTSGSTGRAKGVMIAHRSICNRLLWMQSAFPLGAQDSVLQKTPFSFDASVWEFFVPLLAGARVVMARPGGHQDAAYLVAALAEHAVTVLQLVPSMLQVLVEEEGLETCCALRRLFCGGEALPAKLVRRFRARLDIPVHNLYGPTEASIDATARPFRREGAGGNVPIGRPIGNMRVYVLDAALRPVPTGLTGELYLAGVGLARGYHERPDLTAERFIPDPFGAEPGARLYRTGDVVRYLSSGEIEYVGRADNQVKVRGFRIELGEVETALLGHASVREAVVAAREETGGERRLVAYLVASEGQAPSAAELRAFLKERLPEYMIPAHFVALERMPLMPNGKVDRKALPAPDHARPESGQDYVAPRDETERALCELWAEVLGVERVGVHDNFFELGGDSILSIQVIARARRRNLSLSPQQLFQHQTVAELARVASVVTARQGGQALVTGEVPLTPVQHWYFEQEPVEPHHFNQSVMLRLKRAVAPEVLREAVTCLLRHHDALRMRFVREGTGWRQFNAGDEGEAPFRHVDLSGFREEAAQRAELERVAAETQVSLNLSEGPLVRAVYFDAGANHAARLLIVVHHLVVDGVSWRILLQDLQTACEQLARGGRVELGAKTTSFREWASLLAERARAADVRDEADYWASIAARADAPLPVDEAGGENTQESAATLLTVLSAEETRALLQDAPRPYRTRVDELLLAALARAFADWTGRRELLVDLEGHGRHELPDGPRAEPHHGPDVSRTVGWFTNIFPVVLEAGDGADAGAVVKATKERLRRVPDYGRGYGLLRYLSDDPAVRERVRARAEVVFNYLGQFDQVVGASSWFAPAAESAGAHRGARESRRYLLEVNASVLGGQLRVAWNYSENLHRRETVERLAESFAAALRAVIAHCLAPGAGGYTPSDFPLARVEQAWLDRLHATDPGVEDIYPLSPMQQGMLFHSLSAPGAGLYCTQAYCKLNEPPDPEAFARAWQLSLDRHTALRTTFLWEGLPEPLQLVHGQVGLVLEQHDWRGRPPEEQESGLRAYLRADRERGFDLTRAPLMRLTLLRLDERAYYFVLNQHHLLLDGWSTPILLKEVFTSYEALRRGETPQLAPAAPYRDYIAWLRRQNLSDAERFWRRTLAGFTAPTPLPFDRHAEGTREGEGVKYAEENSLLPEGLTRGLQALARRHQLTLNTIMQGAWGLLLGRYSDGESVVFGSAVSGRPAELPGVEEMVGMFINTLPVRVYLPQDADALTWLRVFHAQQLELRCYEYGPLRQVQAWSDVPRGVPLFESLVLFENYPIDKSLSAHGDTLSVGEARFTEKRHHALTLVVAPEREVLLKIGYDSARFEPATVRRMLRHYVTLLAGIVARPDVKLSELPLLDEAERRQVLEEFSRGPRAEGETAGAADAAATTAGLCAHQLFERRAAAQPDHVAVVHRGEQLTYRELNERANRLAHYLRALGVGPEVRVALMLERSPEAVVAILAVLKAGGAYVPLDPQYPLDRLAFMLEDSAAPVLVTRSELTEDLPAHWGQVVCLDDVAEELEAESSDNPQTLVTPENLAYVIYTSGSTGRPKGVLVPHAGLPNLAAAQRRLFDLRDHSRALQFASLSFDASVSEVFVTLLAGAVLCLPPAGAAHDAEALLALLRDERISCVTLPPSLLAALPGRDLPELRTLVAAGEACPAEVAERWGLGRRFVNAYGPTEATVCATAHVRAGAEAERRAEGKPPIGRPIANAEVYVLDAQLRPVPVGVTGELYLAGVGLARGYLNRPDLTAERFLPHPYSQEPGARLYRTGDLARFLPTGEVEYVGRVDEQVKIRGYRIEPGEIEAALAQHASVREAVVVAREDKPGDRQLVAYVVAEGGELPTVGQWREYLKERLPEYMVPAQFVLLERLPLTASGKIDRRALPAPTGERPSLGREYVAARDEIEETLCDLWAEVLGVERVGVNDNFFDLGGHSLAAMQVTSRISETLRVKVSVNSLFESPTVAGLSAVVVRDEPRPGQVLKIARLVRKIKGMSPEQISETLREKKRGKQEATANG